jgi:hypothetical protein
MVAAWVLAGGIGDSKILGAPDPGPGVPARPITGATGRPGRDRRYHDQPYRQDHHRLILQRCFMITGVKPTRSRMGV